MPRGHGLLIMLLLVQNTYGYILHSVLPACLLRYFLTFADFVSLSGLCDHNMLHTSVVRNFDWEGPKIEKSCDVLR